MYYDNGLYFKHLVGARCHLMANLNLSVSSDGYLMVTSRHLMAILLRPIVIRWLEQKFKLLSNKFKYLLTFVLNFEILNFHTDQIYHIFNQGNNRNHIFFTDENYVYFLRKVKEYISPYGEVLAYCLMPNHFHILIYLKKSEISTSNGKNRTINQSIGLMLMSYSSAINKQEKRSGSLFRARTKIEDGWVDDAITLDHKHSSSMFSPENDYGRICFEYIHNNPVKAKLVICQTDWIYSSARDYAGLRNGTLCNRELAKQLLLI